MNRQTPPSSPSQGSNGLILVPHGTSSLEPVQMYHEWQVHHDAAAVPPPNLASEPDGVKMPSSNDGAPKKTNEKKTPWTIVMGMPLSTFVLAIALLIVIVAAGVGGTAAGMVAVNDAKRACQAINTVGNATSDSITERPSVVQPSAAIASSIIPSSICTNTGTTSDTTTPFTPPTAVTLDNAGCNNYTNNSVFHKTGLWRGKQYEFEVQCGYDYAGGDMFLFVAYRFEDCLKACMSFNAGLSAGYHGAGNATCQAFTFWTDLQSAVDSQGANCFIQYGKSWTPNKNIEYFIGALLLSVTE